MTKFPQGFSMLAALTAGVLLTIGTQLAGAQDSRAIDLHSPALRAAQRASIDGHEHRERRSHRIQPAQCAAIAHGR
jgi:hypothetical protein